jgi:hypothetical protein
MWRTLLTGLLTLCLLTCSPASANERPDAERLLAKQPTQRTLVAGTLIQGTTQDSLFSGRNQVGEILTALVAGDVKDATGQAVIPAGSRVALRIARLASATNKTLSDGQLALEVTSLTVQDREYPVSIRLESTRHGLQGHGVTARDMNRVGSGTMIHWVSGDVVVPRGTLILFVLPQPLTVATR